MKTIARFLALVTALQVPMPASAAGQSYPPAFPRQNATKLVETDRIVVWDIVWPKGQPSPLHRHVYDQVGTSLPNWRPRHHANQRSDVKRHNAGWQHLHHSQGNDARGRGDDGTTAPRDLH